MLESGAVVKYWHKVFECQYKSAILAVARRIYE
jgi:hypothetical protein